MFISCYCPAQGCATWRRQQRALDKLRTTDTGIEGNPRAQFYRDLYESLMPFVTSATMTSAYVLIGDSNERWDDSHCQQSLFDGVVSFAKLLNLDNAMVFAHGGTQRTTQYWTRKEGDGVSCPDQALVSKSLLHAGQVRVGVWQGVPMLGSDHRILALDIDCSRFLGITATRQRLLKPLVKERPPNLYLNNKPKLLAYQRAVVSLYEERDIAGKVQAVDSMAQQRMAQAVPFGTEGAEL